MGASLFDYYEMQEANHHFRGDQKNDLLFYHIYLHRYIVLELKVKLFDSEFAGIFEQVEVMRQSILNEAFERKL